MYRVDLVRSKLACPRVCCRCGGEPVEFRTFYERILQPDVSSVEVGVSIPVCQGCWRRKFYLYAWAILLLGVGAAGLAFGGRGNRVLGALAAIGWFGGFGVLIAAIRSTPIKILDYRPGNDTLSLGCLHAGFATELAQLSGGTKSKYVRVRKSLWVIVLIVLAIMVAAIVLRQ